MNKNVEPLCDVCGADKKVYLEMLGEECWHGHKNVEQIKKEKEVKG